MGGPGSGPRKRLSDEERRERVRANIRRWRARHPDYSKGWNYKNPEKRRSYTEKHLEKKRAIIVAGKSGGCVDCGERDPAVLDYDHLDPREKDLSIASYGRNSIRKLTEEISKCVVRCANCHRRRHAAERAGKWPVEVPRGLAGDSGGKRG